MGIKFYDETQTVYTTSPLRALVNGHTGGSYEKKFYLRNDDVTKYYTNSTLSIIAEAYDAVGELGTSGISIKLMYGELRPTEAEWDVVISGQSIAIPDIGNHLLADTFTYHPIWVRIYVPGNTSADIIDTYSIQLSAFSRVVGV